MFLYSLGSFKKYLIKIDSQRVVIKFLAVYRYFIVEGIVYGVQRDVSFLFQVDGEACRLLPSIITLKLLNKATMLAKRRNAGKPQQDVKLDRLKLPVMKIKMSDYERYHHDKDMLKKAAVMWIADPLDLDAAMDLESLRKTLAKDYNMDTCCFLDCKYHCTMCLLKRFAGFSGHW